MAKKKKLESKAPVPLTRGQLSRAQREQQKIRNLYTFGIAVAGFVVLLLAFALVSTFIIKPNTEVANVNGVKITRATYNKLRSWNLYQQVEQQAIQNQISSQSSTTAVDTSSLTALQNQLKNVDNETSLDSTTTGSLVDNEVLRQKSTSDFKLNPTTDDLKTEAQKDFLPSPTPPPSSQTPSITPTDSPTQAITPTPTGASSVTPSPTITHTPTVTPTKGTPTNTPTSTATYPPVPGASATAQVVYSRYINAIKSGPQPSANDTTGICTFGCPGLSESDYLSIVVEPRYRQNQVTDKLASSIITDVEQIHVQHILTDTEAGALQIRKELDQGADFTTLANQQSSEQITNAKNGSPLTGGDLGWIPQDTDINNLVPEFVAGAWPVKAGEYSQPVHTSFGYHIIKVIERNPHMPLTQTQVDTKKTKLYNDWFSKAKLASQISPASAQAPTPTSPPLVEPTLPPTSATPGATSPVTGTGSLTGTTTVTGTATITASVGGSTPTAPAATAPPVADTPSPTSTKSP